MGFAPTWLRQVSPHASQNHFNHWPCPSYFLLSLHIFLIIFFHFHPLLDFGVTSVGLLFCFRALVSSIIIQIVVRVDTYIRFLLIISSHKPGVPSYSLSPTTGLFSRMSIGVFTIIILFISWIFIYSKGLVYVLFRSIVTKILIGDLSYSHHTFLLLLVFF